MFNVECCNFHDRGSSREFFRGMLLSGYPGGFVFFSGGLPEKRAQVFLWGKGGWDLHRKCGMVVNLLSFLYNYDNLTLELHQGKRSYLDEGWIFIGRFKVGSVPGIGFALKVSKKISKSIMSMMQGH